MPARKSAANKATPVATPTRKSTRVSASSTPAKKRKQVSSDSEAASDFENESSEHESGSDFESEKNGRGNKKLKRDDDYKSEREESEADEEEEDDSDADSRPMKRTVIPLPKLRDEGDTSYQDGTIHENTLLFLRDLKKHNNRDWMKFNDGEFRRAQKDFAAFISELSPLVAEKDFTIPELPSKDIIFRIYRDVRFSKDPTPYKAHFSAAWSRTGKKGPYAAYYFHLEPGNKSFLGGGLWHPEGPSLELLRDDIDQNPQGIKQVLMKRNLKRDYFQNLKGKGGEKEVVAAFCEKNKENALKTKPRNYEVTHQDIALLRLRDFTLSSKISDAEITNTNFLQHLTELIGSLEPFITYLNSVVRPDRRQNGTHQNAQANTAQADEDSDSDGEEDVDEEDNEED